MKVSYNWLKEFVDFQLTAEELAHKLTVAGLEVEEIARLGDDTVIDIGVTPNRSDCLSIRGIAREISAILGTALKDVAVIIEKEEGEGPVVEIENPELCPRYSSRVIRGVKPGPSPEWISKRLEACGIRATSNIVDVTNYVLLELGQPMHAFDLDRLAGGKILIKQAGDLSTFTTLDGEERKLSDEMLLIWDAEKPVAVAGVMGGQNTEVSESSVNILLESACFQPSSVRRTSKTLGLSSEASYRFERGIDRESVAFAMDRAAQLITEVAGGQVTKMTDNYPAPFKPAAISVTFKKINMVIGVDIDESYVEKTLNSLGCKTDRAGEGLTVVPPGFRDDIRRDIDIVEEVARLFGYDNIPSTFPVMQMSAAPENKMQELIKSLKNSMVKSGFSEVINFSFLNPDMLDRLKLPDNDRRRALIDIKNPLRMEDAVMRTTLIPALLNNISTNLNRGERELRLFEVSRVFLKTEQKLPDEIAQLAAVYHRDDGRSIWGGSHDGFYDLKGAVENILSGLKISDIRFMKDLSQSEPYLHPSKSCSIFVGDKKVGAIGALHPAVAESFGIRGNVTITELYDIQDILNLISTRTTFVPLPKFPYVERDLALVVDDDITVDAVRQVIDSVETGIIESVNLFDVYKGKSIAEGSKSLAFNIRYRSIGKTLTDSEVDAVHSEILRMLQDNLKAELRT